MDTNVYNGVRAEPKFLRDPTSFESISSGISRLSSYVTSNLPKRKSLSSPYDPHLYQQQQQMMTAAQAQQLVAAAVAQSQAQQEDPLVEDEGGADTTEEGMDIIAFASFDKLEYRKDKHLSCLLLGYHDGFQLWDITNPDNVHELCSIRDKELFGTVSFIHIVKNKDRRGPLLAIVSETTTAKDNTSTATNLPPTDIPRPQHKRMDSNTSSSTTSSSTTTANTAKKSSHLLIYSLQSQSIIKEITDFTTGNNSSTQSSATTMNDEGSTATAAAAAAVTEDDTTVVTCIKSNHKVIVLGCLSRHKSSIHLLNTSDFKPFASPLTDIYHDSTTGPVFTVGSRFIAYATNTAVLNSDPVMTSLTNKSISYTGFGVLQGEKDVKGAAKDIAKEMVSGMKTLGEFGLNTLSNYFGKETNQQQQQPVVEYGSSPSSRRTISPRQPSDLYNSNSSTTTSNSASAGAGTGTGTTNKKMIPSGMIMIRDILKLPTTPTRNLSISTIAHFRPHTHPVTCLTFNQAGTLLMSASKQGHTFHIFSILTNTSTAGNAAHVYSLSRGITDAQVEDCQFSVDSTWCAITTARGTTHVYAINPYGGKPEISGHVHGKVNNPTFHPFMSKSKAKATTLNSVVRIKQRRKMPGSGLNYSTSLPQDDLNKFNTTYGYYGPTPPHYIPAMPIVPQQSGTNIMQQKGSTSKEPRAKITAMFVTATKSPYLVNNSSVYNYNKGGVTTTTATTTTSTTSTTDSSTTSTYNSPNFTGSIKQQASSMLSSFGSGMSHLPYLPSASVGSSVQQQLTKKWNQQDKSDTLMFGFDEEYDDSAKMMNDEIGYQDLYSFHPDGILTLHRCWVGKTVVKKRENGRNLEKLDLSLREEDVAEWKVARNSDWDQVKLSIASPTPPSPPTTPSAEEEVEASSSPPSSPPQQTKKKNKNKPKQPELPPTPLYKQTPVNKKLWLSNAEITTYATTEDPAALWTHHQFSFQTYKEKNEKELQKILNSGLIPSTNTMIMLKGMPEPVSSRIGRVSKTNTRIANDKVEDNMEVALAELEDSISKAMQTSFSPSSTSMSNSSPAKWLSSSAKSANTQILPSPSLGSNISGKSFLDKNSSVSFEDAYLIHMGSGPSPEPPTNLQHSSLIQFDNSSDDDLVVANKRGMEEEEDIIKFEDNLEESNSKVYSPDGDNEVGYPSESVYGDFNHHGGGAKNVEDEENDPW